MGYCFIYWSKGNLYGHLSVFKTRQEADEIRMFKAKQGFEVSALAETQ